MISVAENMCVNMLRRMLLAKKWLYLRRTANSVLHESYE